MSSWVIIITPWEVTTWRTFIHKCTKILRWWRHIRRHVRRIHIWWHVCHLMINTSANSIKSFHWSGIWVVSHILVKTSLSNILKIPHHFRRHSRFTHKVHYSTHCVRKGCRRISFKCCWIKIIHSNIAASLHKVFHLGWHYIFCHRKFPCC